MTSIASGFPCNQHEPSVFIVVSSVNIKYIAVEK